SRSLAVQLAEPADVLERHRRLPESLVLGIDGLHLSEVQNRPQQHGGMPVRKYEPISVWPDRVLRIKIHHAVPDGVNQWRQRHRRTGMARFCLLDSIDRERADGVDS